MIEFKNVYKTYSTGTEAVNNANFRIEKGDFAFLVGASGSGKSTLIKLILKEEEPTSGNIIINGKDTTFLKPKRVPFLRRSMGVVFQDFRLLPDKTVYDNVAFAMNIVKATPKHIRRQVPMVLSLVGLSGKAKVYPHELSGGEQQRVALARALVNNPSMIIADEPTRKFRSRYSLGYYEFIKRNKFKRYNRSNCNTCKRHCRQNEKKGYRNRQGCNY